MFVAAHNRFGVAKLKFRATQDGRSSILNFESPAETACIMG
jgi:hypothetical protein